MEAQPPLYRYAVSTFLAVLLVTLPYSLAVANTFDEEDMYEMPTDDLDYEYRTVSLVGVSLISGAILASNLDRDKKQHFAVSVAFGAGSEYLLRQLNISTDDRWQRLLLATAMGTLPGLAKEFSDSQFSGGDLAADIAGSFTGALMADLIQGPAETTVMLSANNHTLGLVFLHRF